LDCKTSAKDESVSDQAEKHVDESTAEDEVRPAGDANGASGHAAPAEDEAAVEQAEAAIAEEEVNDQTDEGAGEVTPGTVEASEEQAIEEPAIMKKPLNKKQKLEELDPIKRALMPKPKEEGPIVMDWYILKVQSNRERSIADALKRKIAIEGLDRYFDQVVVPTEKVTEFKGGKKKVVERKLYPGYIVVHMCINDDTWFAVRETSGIGDFTGSAGKPTPMLPQEVARIIKKDEEEVSESPKLNINFKIGDRVKIKEGTFESFEGEVHLIDEQNGRISVMINIFGRSTPVELEYWQVEVL
jgi:transcription termination/antitermination protein NusG